MRSELISNGMILKCTWNNQKSRIIPRYAKEPLNEKTEAVF